jgi:hydrogenase nickel incorporation protein HypA/HybF
MHEHSLTSGLIHTIDTLAREHGAKRAVAVNVVLGALCNISAEHFREHFVEAARDTVARDARLFIRTEDDIQDPNALHVMLESVEFEE